jgi:hypothetical protein
VIRGSEIIRFFANPQGIAHVSIYARRRSPFANLRGNHGRFIHEYWSRCAAVRRSGGLDADGAAPALLTLGFRASFLPARRLSMPGFFYALADQPEWSSPSQGEERGFESHPGCLAAGSRQQAAGSRQQTAENEKEARAGQRLPAVCYRLPAIFRGCLTVGRRSLKPPVLVRLQPPEL